MRSSVGVTVANVKAPETPEPAPQATGGPTQKPGLAGSVWMVGPPKGLICVLPVTDVVKLYVLPTIVALALGAVQRAKVDESVTAAAKTEHLSPRFMGVPFHGFDIKH